MRFSELFTKTTKESASDADSINADLLTRAGYIHKTMAGAYSFLPLGLIVLRKIEQVVREEMNAIGSQELLLSALAPKEDWSKTDRWETLDVLFKVPAAGEQEYALNPTHEEVISPLAKHFVQSHRDLPFSAYQVQTKFRNELRAKSGILRGREFLMKDMYSFDKDQKSLDAFYEKAQSAYEKIFDRLGIGERTYLTYASGGSFSKYSHEYQVLLSQGEDIIYISEEAEKKGKRIAINKEIYEEGKTVCPETGGKAFREEKASEAGNIFKLGTKFSDPFELQYTDEHGERKPIIMGCYGIGISRLMGILAEACSDESGLKWPENIAPAKYHIVIIAKSEDDEAFKEGQKLYEQLIEKGIPCLLDDRLELSVGAKLADADLIGVPTRIVISPKTLAEGKVERKERDSDDSTLVSPDSL